jgi:uncharacterized membrane protein
VRATPSHAAESSLYPVIADLDSAGRVLVRVTSDCGDCQGVGPGSYLVQDGVRTDLAAPAGFPDFGAFDMNDRGEVVGVAYNGADVRGFIWRGSVPTAIDVPVNSLGHTNQLRINERGHVASGDGDTIGNVYLFREGVATLLGPGSVSDFNDADDIIGAGATDAEFVLFRDGKRIAIPELRLGLALNEARQIAGGTATHAAIWTAGSVKTVATSFFQSWADNINERGDVIGSYATPAGDYGAFFWRDGKTTDFGVGAGVRGLNDAGEVVGFTPGFQPFVWRDGVMTRLPLPTGILSAVPERINRSGVVAGAWFAGTDEKHDTGVLVWTPTSCGNEPPDAGPPPEPPPPEDPGE